MPPEAATPDFAGLTCEKCGFDLRAAREPVCPECGLAFDARVRRKQMERTLKSVGAIAFLLYLAGGVMTCAALTTLVSAFGWDMPGPAGALSQSAIWMTPLVLLCGLGVLAVGVGLARRRRWARGAAEAIAWLWLAAICACFLLAIVVGWMGGGSAASDPAFLLFGLLLFFLYGLLVSLSVRTLRSPDARALMCSAEETAAEDRLGPGAKIER